MGWGLSNGIINNKNNNMNIVARMEEVRTTFKILKGTPTGEKKKKPLGRPRRRWENNIRMDIKEICIKIRNWVDSAHDRDDWRASVNAALNPRVPYSMKLELII